MSFRRLPSHRNRFVHSRPSSKLQTGEPVTTSFNESNGDRAVRMLVGILLAAAGWGLASGLLGVALMGVGAVALGTGIVGWCPAYTAFGLSTRRVAAGHCPRCEGADRG